MRIKFSSDLFRFAGGFAFGAALLFATQPSAMRTSLVAHVDHAAYAG